jgi:hypothetical protein
MAYDPDDDAELDTPVVSEGPADPERESAWDWREQQATQPTALPQRPLQGPAQPAQPEQAPAPKTGLTRVNAPSLADRAFAKRAPRLEDYDTANPIMTVGNAREPPPPEAGVGSNLLSVVWKGVLSNAADIMGAARFAEQQLTSDPETNTWIEEQRKSLEEQVAKDYSDPKLQKIMSASWMSMFGGSTDAKGNHIPTPGEVGWMNYFMYNTASMIPTVALAVLPATTTAKVATKLMSSMGAVSKTAKAVGTAASIGESAGQFGLQNMGALYNSVSEEVMRTPEAEMRKSHAYVELRNTGQSDEQAKQTLIKQTIPPMALQALLVGGAVGAGFLGMAARGGIAPLVGQGLKARIVGAGVGATEMGAMMGGQAAANTALGQQAEQGIGIREGYDTDAIRANAVAAAGGSLGMGATFGAYHPPVARPRAEPRPAPDVAPDHDAALRAALPQPDAAPDTSMPPPERNPLATAPPPEAAPGEQQEMFHPTQHGPTVEPGMAPEPPAPERTEFPPSMSPVDTGDRTPGYREPQHPSYALTEPEPGKRPAVKPPEPGLPIVTEPTADPGLGMHGAEQPDLLGGEPTRYAPPPESTPPAPVEATAAPRTVDSSRGGSRAAPGEPPPSAGMKVGDIRDALMSEHGMSLSDVKGMSAADARARYDKLSAQARVGEGSAPTTGERSRPGEPVVAPPTGEAHSPQTSAGVETPATKAVAAMGEAKAAAGEAKAAGELRARLDSSKKALDEAKAAREATPTHGPEPRVTELAAEVAATKDFRPASEPTPVVKTPTVSETLKEAQAAKGPPDAQKRKELRALGVPKAGKMNKAELQETYARVMKEQEEAKRGFVAEPVKPPEPTKARITLEAEAPKAAPKAAEPKAAPKVPEPRVAPKAAEPAVRGTLRASPKAAEKLKEAAPKPVEKKVDARAELSEEEATADRAKEIARGKAMEDIGFVTRNTVNRAPPGTPMHRAMRQAVEDLGRLVNLTDGSREHITDVTNRMLEPRSGDTEIAAKARAEVAKAYYERNIGEKYNERTGDEEGAPVSEAAAAQAEEVAERTASAAQGPAKAEDIEAKGTGGGTGESAGQTMGLETKNQDVTKTSNSDRKAGDWFKKILDTSDPTTVHDAADTYDNVNGRGRPRDKEYATLADALATEIKRVNTASNSKLFRDNLAEIAKRKIEGKPGTDAYEARVKKRDAAMDRMTDALKDFEPERIQQLEAALKELTDAGRGKRADIGAKMGERIARSHELAPDAPRVLKMARDPRLSAGVENLIRTSERNDVELTDRDVLNHIINDPLVRKERPALRALAQQLIKVARDVQVMTPLRAFEQGRITKEDYNAYTAFGRFDAKDGKGNDFITINIDRDHPQGTHLETALHEITHSAYSDYIASLEKQDPTHPDLLALEAMRTEIGWLAYEAHKKGELDSVAYENIRYATSDPHEFHTMMMSNADLHAFTASRKAPTDLTDALARLGHWPRTGTLRSIWNSFTNMVRKSLGFEKPKSEAEYTLFDHVIQPVTDIANRAAKFNRQLFPRDEAGVLLHDRAIRTDAEPLNWGMRDVLGDRAGEVATRALALAGDRLKPPAVHNLLQTIHLDRMVDRYGSKFQDGAVNHIKNVRTAVERAGVASRRFLDKFSAEAGEITRELVKHDDVAELMNDAGYARAALGTRDAAANAHLTSREERATLAALQTKFDTMPAEKQELYKKTRDFLNKKYAAERDAVSNNLINRFMPGSSDAEKATMRDILKSKTKLDAFLKKPENFAIADESKRIAKGMAHLTRLGFVDGDYFPMRRYGDFVVEYGGQHGDPGYGVQFFEGASEAAAFRNKMLADGVPDVSSVRERNSIVQRGEMRLSPVVEQMIDAVKKDPALRAHAAQLEEMAGHLQLQYASGWEKDAAKRKYVLGASKDVARAIATDLEASGRRIGTIEHGGERDAALEAMKHFNDATGRDPNNADNTDRDRVYHELQQRFQKGAEINHTGWRGMARRFSAFGYAQSMMSMSRAPVEAYEMTSKMLAFIGARHGYGRAALELGKALKDLGPKIVARGGANTLDALLGKPMSSVNYRFSEMAKQRLLDRGYDRSEVDAFFKHFDDNGLLDNTQAASLRELARPGKVGNVWDRFIEVSSALTHATEEMSRIGGAWAAFRTARGKGEAVHGALDFAENTLRKAPNYSEANRARITTSKGSLGGMAAPIMQFKQYGLNESWLIANLFRDSFKSADPAVRKEAAMQLAGTIMMHSLAAGALTWLADPVRYLGGAYDLATGNKPRDRMLDMRKWLSETLGPTLGEVVGAGVPHLAGMDLSHRLGVNNMFNIPQLNGFTPKDWAEFTGHLAFGAQGEDTGNVVSGVAKMVDGDITGGLTAMLPRILRDPVKAYGLANKGVTDSRGKEILSPKKISPLEIAYQAIGITPSDVSEARMGRQAIVQAREQVTETRTKLMQHWLEADPADRADAWARIARYNADAKTNLGAKITRDQLVKQLNERKKSQSSPGTYGLKLPKASARQLKEYGAFAQH